MGNARKKIRKKNDAWFGKREIKVLNNDKGFDTAALRCRKWDRCKCC